MRQFNNKTLVLVLILILGAFLRFYNLNWDQDFHLHPDERFLTMVGEAMKLPANISEYLNPAISTFNPTNIGFNFYVYGTFPVVLNKIIAVILQMDNYNAFTLLGRLLSGLSDLMIVLLVYKTLSLFEKKYKLDKSIKLYGAFFYAIAMLPIQLSHFFAVDTFLNFFMFASFYFILSFRFNKKSHYLILSAIFLGLAIASKITALFLIPLVFAFITLTFWQKSKKKFAYKASYSVLLFSLISYITLRFADPYIFQTSNFFDLRPNQIFASSLRTLNQWFSQTAWYPPGVQWLDKTPLFPFTNIIFFGLGFALSVFVFFGIISIFSKPKRLDLVFALVWVFGFSIFQSFQFAKTMRYFIIFYPYFVILAAFGFRFLLRTQKRFIKILALIFTLIWPLAFMSVYTKPQTRIAASEWIYNQIPDKSLILTEYWDDTLPLPLKNTLGKTFTNIPLHVFDMDTKEKWEKIDSQLDAGDYYILSSNRGWGSIIPLSKRYPKMSKFYKDLLEGKTSYKKVKEFSSYPSLRYLGIPLDFPDELADEALSVHDHPKILIFKNTR